MSRTRKQTFRAVLVALLVLLLLGGARWVFLHTIYESSRRRWSSR